MCIMFARTPENLKALTVPLRLRFRRRARHGQLSFVRSTCQTKIGVVGQCNESIFRSMLCLSFIRFSCTAFRSPDNTVFNFTTNHKP